MGQIMNKRKSQVLRDDDFAESALPRRVCFSPRRVSDPKPYLPSVSRQSVRLLGSERTVRGRTSSPSAGQLDFAGTARSRAARAAWETAATHDDRRLSAGCPSRGTVLSDPRSRLTALPHTRSQASDRTSACHADAPTHVARKLCGILRHAPPSPRRRSCPGPTRGRPATECSSCRESGTAFRSDVLVLPPLQSPVSQPQKSTSSRSSRQRVGAAQSASSRQGVTQKS